MKKIALISGVILIAAALLIIFVVKPTGKKDYAIKDYAIKDYTTKDYTWHAEFGGKDGDLLIRGVKIDEIKNDMRKLIYAVNRSEENPETFRTPAGKEPIGDPKLKLIDIKDAVVNVEVINDECLTQRMGTTGAEIFLVEATFTLTEYDNIKFVNFIFEEGDHAVPGLYSREDYLKKWKVAK